MSALPHLITVLVLLIALTKLRDILAGIIYNLKLHSLFRCRSGYLDVNPQQPGTVCSFRMYLIRKSVISPF
jgi:hypothetical protein